MPTTEQVLSVKHFMNKVMFSHSIVLSTWEMLLQTKHSI